MTDSLQETDAIPGGGSQAQALDIHIYRSGDEIIREGEEFPRFCVLLSGQVRIIRRGRKIRLLSPQDVFGLEGIVAKEPSPYTAKALKSSRVASYGPEALDLFLRESPRMTYGILQSTLGQLSETTRNFSKDSETFTIQDVRVQFFKDGEMIIEGDAEGRTEFYRLVSTQGGLRVAVGGKEISRIATPGAFFGEMAVLLNIPCQATVTSIGESVVETYTADDMDIIVRDYPETAIHIMRALADRLMHTNPKLAWTPIR